MRLVSTLLWIYSDAKPLSSHAIVNARHGRPRALLQVAEIGKKESVFYNVKSAKAFSKGTRAIVGGINSDGKGVSQILSFEGGARTLAAH